MKVSLFYVYSIYRIHRDGAACYEAGHQMAAHRFKYFDRLDNGYFNALSNKKALRIHCSLSYRNHGAL